MLLRRFKDWDMSEVDDLKDLLLEGDWSWSLALKDLISSKSDSFSLGSKFWFTISGSSFQLRS